MDLQALVEGQRRNGRRVHLPARVRGLASARPIQRFAEVRAATLQLARALSPEDQCVQSMPDASPTKWHLAHTTWFFEALVLQPQVADYRCFDERYGYLFNSYYECLGPRHARDARGLLTRPSADQILEYRQYVDRAMHALLERRDTDPAIEALVDLGLHHEQQHQELILTDIKHAFFSNPLRPAYRAASPPAPDAMPAPPRWIAHPGGMRQVGHRGPGFAFDNECPRHHVLLKPFELASRPVTCGEFLEFMLDGGYRRPELWLSDGFSAVHANGWSAPLYWEQDGAREYRVFTLHGWQPLNPAEPVCHVNFYEACAFAAWSHARLPTEFEWEAAAASWHGPREAPSEIRLHPGPVERDAGTPETLCGTVWQWTRSSYDPYPGFVPHAGPAAEYNGKFMVGQVVLRGGSCVTPCGHIRITYRNYFPAASRWQFSGLRLARDA